MCASESQCTFTESRHTPKAVTFCQFIAHSLTLLLSPYDLRSLSGMLSLSLCVSHQCLQSAIAPVLFCCCCFVSLSASLRARTILMYSIPAPFHPHLTLSSLTLVRSPFVLLLCFCLLFGSYCFCLLLLLLLGALKGLICICTLWVLCVTLLHPLPSLFSLALSLPLPFGTCPKPESTMFIIIRLLLSYTFEGWLSFYWVSRAFCYPIILR